MRMREEPFRRPMLAAILFGAGFVVARDMTSGASVTISLIISFVIWLNVAFG